MGLRAPSRVLPRQFRQVELINHIDDKVVQVIFPQLILHGGRKKIVSFPISGYEIYHHSIPVTACGPHYPTSILFG
jgi:hypothetical protein